VIGASNKLHNGYASLKSEEPPGSKKIIIPNMLASAARNHWLKKN
jgi:hypothetical protein